MPDLFPGDGVGNDVLGMARALQDAGENVLCICYHTLESIPHEKAQGFLEALLRDRDTTGSDDLLIYHYAVEWVLGDQIYEAFRGRRVLRYHNVTPAELLVQFNRKVADSCRRGRVRLTGLSRPDLLLADSEANRTDYQTLTGFRPIHAVVSPFSQTEDLLKCSTDPVLKERLNRFTALRFLFVGRISPHKNVDALISDLDAALSESDRPLRSTWLSRWGKSELIPDRPVLFIAGGFSPAFRNYNRKVRKAARKTTTLQVEFYSGLTGEALATLYRGADYFITESLHEGFCVPVVEAMAFNLPLLLPDAPIYHETSQEQANFFRDLRTTEIGPPSSRRTDGIFMEHYSRIRLSSFLIAQLMQIASGYPIKSG